MQARGLLAAVAIAGCYRPAPAPATVAPPTCGELQRQQLRAAWARWKHGDERAPTLAFEGHVPRDAREEQVAVRRRRDRAAAAEQAAQCLSAVIATDSTISAAEAYDFMQQLGGPVYARDLLGRMLATYVSLGRSDDAIAARAIVERSR
jgi:hypothetical protein